MRISLTIEVDYDTEEYADESDALAEIQTVLHRSAERMVGEGGLSGSLPVTVESWEAHTDRVEG